MTPKEDLDRSGLSQSTIASMGIRPLTPLELDKHQRGFEGHAYLIPYFDLAGKRLPDFYRTRFLPPLKIQGNEVKYLQPKGSTTHVYIPPGIPYSTWQNTDVKLRFTEGEKKAAKACQEGIITLGLGGVDAWRSRRIQVSLENLTQHGEKVTVKLNGGEQADSILEQIAPELLQINWEGREVEIAFDSDMSRKPDVQRAAFEFGVWMASEGAYVKIVVLPDGPGGEKQGLDDYLLNNSVEAFEALPRTLPQHPRLRAWLRRTLDSNRLKRSDSIKAAQAVLNSLDARGQRFVDYANGAYYYWDESSNILHGFRWESAEIRQIRLSTFGSFVQEQYGIGATDATIMGRIADLFASGKSLRSVTPRRVSHASAEAVYYQLSDSEVVKVTSGGLEFASNGLDDILFLSGQVEPLSISPEVIREVSQEQAKEGSVPRWITALASVNLQAMSGMSIEQTRVLVAGLFYLSPLFRRWRGLMLPVELVIAEPNSGKTFLFNLRKAILNGRPSLDNPPPTQKDWYAQMSGSGGMWVCDNLGDPSKDLKDHMSDELARLVTDPDPKIEVRKLYTTMDTGVYPIDATFAITSIRNPFWKPDILQRSIMLHMKAVPKGARDPMWYQRQIRGDGRARWVVDQLLMAQKFLQEVEKNWSDTYLSSHRLVHFEQALRVMGRAMRQEELMEGAIEHLFSNVQELIVDSDPIMDALRAFVEELPRGIKEVTTSDVCKWVTADLEDRYSHLHVLSNPVRLGKYMATHEYDISEVVGLTARQKGNSKVYTVTHKKRAGEE